MADGITVHVLGDYGPFSRTGKSISYLVSVGRSNYLIDCGAPLFQQIGGFGLKDIKGLIITHCHDDHKRWFTDLALFHRYAPDLGYKLRLVASEEIHDHLVRSSGPALERGLSADSSTITDLSFDAYVDHNLVGPGARFRISSEHQYGVNSRLCVVDEEDKVMGPEVAKVVINPQTNIARMLLKDPEYGEWVEPVSFYSYSSDFFYTKEKNPFRDEEGFTIEALNAPVWHGITGNGIKIKTQGETVVFSSDTIRDQELWHRLCSEKKVPRLNMPAEKFESVPVIYGDINNYIERIWSQRRYDDAVHAFDDAVVVHDVAVRDNIVHTHYKNIKSMDLGKGRLLLTHSPDRMTSEWALMKTGKTFRVKGDAFYEIVGGEPFSMDADIFHKEAGKYFVGYKNGKGRFLVYEEDGVLGLCPRESECPGSPLFSVDLYQDLSGRYFPVLDEGAGDYFERQDGKVEIVRYHDHGSIGAVVEKHRKRIPVAGI